ncbi:hypothetical protein [Promicromonospora sp. NFX87]|uniref:hypothetical protein n=1 Tax=Promicromonospora sp. NFX87 TaxID=3402691 RepID=UPI003AFB7C76
MNPTPLPKPAKSVRSLRPSTVGVVLAASAALLTACSGGQPAGSGSPASSAPVTQELSATPTPAASPADTPAAEPAAPEPPADDVDDTVTTPSTGEPGAPEVSDLSGLGITGISEGTSVLIDVAGDGADRFLEVGADGVDFTGTGRTDTTMMSLHPAAVPEENRVLIKPPFWYEEPTGGYCVTDTEGAALALEPCKAGDAAQVWQVVLAGDSGLFELHGAYGVVGVQDGRITTAGGSDTGLQVLPYAE